MEKKNQGTLDWQELLNLTKGEEIVVERVRLREKGIAIEGAFQLPELCRLAVADQVFIAAFVCAHGSIKRMEETFGVSYPTIKARLNRLATELNFVEVAPQSAAEVATLREQILARLGQGELTAEEAIRLLEGMR